MPRATSFAKFSSALTMFLQRAVLLRMLSKDMNGLCLLNYVRCQCSGPRIGDLADFQGGLTGHREWSCSPRLGCSHRRQGGSIPPGMPSM